MKPLKRAVSVLPKWSSWCAEMLRRTGLPMEDLQRIYDEEFVSGETWMNDLYVVIAKPIGADSTVAKFAPRVGVGTHLSIRRQDRAACRDWRHFQQIKNQLCGPEREAVELYPAESRLVDGANQFHLWVMPEGLRVPVGWMGPRAVAGPGEAMFGAVQRPLVEESDCGDSGESEPLATPSGSIESTESSQSPDFITDRFERLL